MIIFFRNANVTQVPLCHFYLSCNRIIIENKGKQNEVTSPGGTTLCLSAVFLLSVGLIQMFFQVNVHFMSFPRRILRMNAVSTVKTYLLLKYVTILEQSMKNVPP